ncbi:MULTISPECIES: SGNH/GDSL hydrolase family protein [unclassified Paenibacillus]|uniref:SGNH/GDSL hydrolase family protein n=1 Tax=unclassified Paenibacillus TaxID=185978 RepID=UPI002F3E2EB5
MLFSQNQKLLFIGDSITDCGRSQPIGEGRGGALGNGYVALVDALIQATYPELNIRIVNKGISGNTVRDLNSRWQQDVIEQKPDWLAIKIGINDVWRQFDTPLIPECHVYEEEYAATLRKLVQETKPLVTGLVLMSPFYLEENRQDKMRSKMDTYSAIVKSVAEEHGAIFVDTQAAFDKVLEHRYAAALAWDRVHPSYTGHMVLAKAFLNHVGFEWNKQ